MGKSTISVAMFNSFLYVYQQGPCMLEVPTLRPMAYGYVGYVREYYRPKKMGYPQCQQKMGDDLGKPPYF